MAEEKGAEDKGKRLEIRNMSKSKKMIYHLVLLVLVINFGLIVFLWQSGCRPLMNCSGVLINPYPEGEKYKGFEAAKDLDYCGGYNEDFMIGCEKYMKQMHLYFKNCVE